MNGAIPAASYAVNFIPPNHRNITTSVHLNSPSIDSEPAPLSATENNGRAMSIISPQSRLAAARHHPAAGLSWAWACESPKLRAGMSEDGGRCHSRHGSVMPPAPLRWQEVRSDEFHSSTAWTRPLPREFDAATTCACLLHGSLPPSRFPFRTPRRRRRSLGSPGRRFQRRSSEPWPSDPERASGRCEWSVT